MISEEAKYKLWKREEELEEEQLKRLKDIDMEKGEFKFFHNGICPNCGSENVRKTQKKINDEDLKMGNYERTFKSIGKLNKRMKEKYNYEPFIVFFECNDCNHKSGYKEV